MTSSYLKIKSRLLIGPCQALPDLDCHPHLLLLHYPGAPQAPFLFLEYTTVILIPPTLHLPSSVPETVAIRTGVLVRPQFTCHLSERPSEAALYGMVFHQSLSDSGCCFAAITKNHREDFTMGRNVFGL
jgi:hypothetical protein